MKALLLLFVNALLAPWALAAPLPGSEKMEFTEEHRFIFFAVLEGLYGDGLSDESVDAILGARITDHFVVSCPICGPAYDAIRAYREAPEFTTKKVRVKGFGVGLSDAEREILAGPVEGRRRLIRALVSRWIEARFAACHLPEDREEALRSSLRRMSGEGTEALKRLQRGEHGEALAVAYAGWEYCPSCSGTTLHDPSAGDQR